MSGVDFQLKRCENLVGYLKGLKAMKATGENQAKMGELTRKHEGTSSAIYASCPNIENTLKTIKDDPNIPENEKARGQALTEELAKLERPESNLREKFWWGWKYYVPPPPPKGGKSRRRKTRRRRQTRRRGARSSRRRPTRST